MAITKLNPYLMFNGTAEKAIALYKSTLGAKIEGRGLMRFGDVPGGAGGPEDKNRVMHAELHVGAGVFMVSDSMPNSAAPPETNAQVSVAFDDVADMTAKFTALSSAGGKVLFPVHDAFWGDKFGMLMDAFGITWLFVSPVKPGST